MKFLGLDIYEGKYKDFLKLLKEPSSLTLVFTPNPEILLAASNDPVFHETLRKANYLVPDANGLYIGSLLQDKKNIFEAIFLTLFRRKALEKRYGELIAGSDLTKDLVQYAHKESKRILVIDTYRVTDPVNAFEARKKQIQNEFIALLSKKYSGISVQLFFLSEMSPDAIAHYIEINKIDYVFATCGMKAQESILTQVFAYLPVYAKVVGLGVGSSFDYILGLQKRAPKIFRKFGLEWLYRFLMSPVKRWSRIKNAIWEFPKMIAKNTH